MFTGHPGYTINTRRGGHSDCAKTPIFKERSDLRILKCSDRKGCRILRNAQDVISVVFARSALAVRIRKILQIRRGGRPMAAPANGIEPFCADPRLPREQ